MHVLPSWYQLVVLSIFFITFLTSWCALILQKNIFEIYPYFCATPLGVNGALNFALSQPSNLRLPGEKVNSVGKNSIILLPSFSQPFALVGGV
jgi:hypothetical protein